VAMTNTRLPYIGAASRPTVTTLGWLSLVPVALLLLAQAVGAGSYSTVGGVLPIFDSGIWASCSSALAHGNQATDFAWCLRRPLSMLVQAPLYLLAPMSIAAAVLVQTLLVCLALWFFLVALLRSISFPRWGLVVVYVLAVLVVFTYGPYLGPEGMALALSFVSAGAILNFLRQRTVSWGLLAIGAAVVVMQMRPGNPVVLAALVVGVLGVLGRERRHWLVILSVVLGLTLLWAAPTRVMQSAGWPSAGHATNFWSAAYSAATPEIDNWTAAYDRFGPDFGCPPVAQWSLDLCHELESEAFGNRLRDAAFNEIRTHPEALARQAASNTVALLGMGYLNHMLGVSYPPNWQIWKPEQRLAWAIDRTTLGTFFSAGLWLASLAVLAGLIVGTLRLGRKGWPFAGSLDEPSRRIGATVWLGLFTIAGAFGSYALIGHDDPQRHLVQGVPYLLAAMAGLTGLMFPSQAQQSIPPPRRRWPRAVLGSTIALVLVVAFVEGRSPTASLTIAVTCNTASPTRSLAVVGQVPAQTAASLASPADWRRLAVPAASVILSSQSRARLLLENVPDGQLLLLRNSTGELFPVFVADDDLLHQRRKRGPWCMLAPSQYDSMIVRDLIPAV